MTLRAIIFDVDGTLAETEELHRAAFNRAFAEAGLGWEWGEALYGELLDVAGGKERLAHYAARVGHAIGADAIARLHARKTGFYGEAVGGCALRPGVAALIEAARAAGISLAIATTTTRANVDALLDAALASGAAAWFTIVAGDEVPRKKPAPDVYLAALTALGLSAADCVAIEDSPDGLKAARAAGIATLVTPSRYMAGGDFSGAARVVADLAALPDPLGALRALTARRDGCRDARSNSQAPAAPPRGR